MQITISAPAPHSGTTPAIPPADLAAFVQLAHRATGITLAGKPDFVTLRLQRRLAATGSTSYGQYRALLDSDVEERQRFAEALTTHTTSFFRERPQYDWLAEEGLPELHRTANRTDLVIWSAACSIGHEGYSALMVADAAAGPNAGARATLIGTDLSRAVIREARTGIYPEDQIAAIPLDLRRRFLLSSRAGDGRYRIAPELRARSTWRVGNLVSAMGLDGIMADIVFLRNVLIYFDEATRRQVIANVCSRLRVGGVLLMGHAEAGLARRDELEVIRPSIYRKVA